VVKNDCFPKTFFFPFKKKFINGISFDPEELSLQVSAKSVEGQA
jgi:hypothetical protein